MNKDDKRGIFFGVVGVLTLIVAIIGASLAYFSINAQSDEDAITVQAASVQIVYEDGDGIAVTGLIPSTKEIALKSLDRYLNAESDAEGTPYQECVDDNNNVVCAVYEFSLTNKATNPVELTARVQPRAIPTDEEGNPTYTAFQNLKYTLYDITAAAELTNGKAQTDENVTAIEVSEGVIDGSVTYDAFNILPTATTLEGNNTTKVYRLFIWLDEQFDDEGQMESQDYEQGAQFYGQVFIDVAGEGQGNITGTINEDTGA